MWPRDVNYNLTPVLQNSSCSNLFPLFKKNSFFLVDSAGNTPSACLSIVPFLFLSIPNSIIIGMLISVSTLTCWHRLRCLRFCRGKISLLEPVCSFSLDHIHVSEHPQSAAAPCWEIHHYLVLMEVLHWPYGKRISVLKALLPCFTWGWRVEGEICPSNQLE